MTPSSPSPLPSDRQAGIATEVPRRSGHPPVERPRGVDLRTVRAGEQPRLFQSFSAGAGETDLVPSLATSGDRLFLESLVLGVGAGTQGHPGDVPVRRELYTGRSGEPLEQFAACPPNVSLVPGLRSIDVSGDVVAYIDCDERPTVQDLSLGPASVPQPLAPHARAVRIAGRYVAWLDGGDDSGSLRNSSNLVVFDWTQNTTVLTVPRRELPGVIQSFDLREDGTVAVAFVTNPDGSGRSRVAIGVASPAVPSLRLLQLPTREAYTLRFAGDRLIFLRAQRPSGMGLAEIGITSVEGDAQIFVRNAAGGTYAEAFDVSDSRFSWRALACSGQTVYLDGLPSGQSRDGRRRGCRLMFRRPPVVRDGRVRFFLSCAGFDGGCWAERLRLTATRVDQVIASGRPRTTETPSLKLNQRGRELVRRNDRLRVRLSGVIRDAFGLRESRSTNFTLRP